MLGDEVNFAAGRCEEMARERNITMLMDLTLKAAAASGSLPRTPKSRFWVGWVVTFVVGGVLSGLTALFISLLTALTILERTKSLSVVVSALLVGCLVALLLSAHGMDRIGAVRRG